ncbi:MAG: hypothetical protein MZW92_61440 [Comamonadaceae bacterium]|nr:hypothetical protein [Comamonadaceae bacterium]
MTARGLQRRRPARLLASMRNCADDLRLHRTSKAAMYINSPARRPSVPGASANSRLHPRASQYGPHLPLTGRPDHLTSVDIDQRRRHRHRPGRQTTDRIYRHPRTRGSGAFTAAAGRIDELSYDARTASPVLPGGSCVAAADFDSRRPTSTSSPARSARPPTSSTTTTTARLLLPATRSPSTDADLRRARPVGILADDFTGDGRPDMFVATDSAYRGGYAPRPASGSCGNRGPRRTATSTGCSSCLNACTAPTPSTYDIDMGHVARLRPATATWTSSSPTPTHSGDYYLHRERAGQRLRALRHRPHRRNVGAGFLDSRPPRRHPRPRSAPSDQGVRGRLQRRTGRRGPLSNNGGQSWETYQTFSAAGSSTAPTCAWYDFNELRRRPALADRPDRPRRTTMVDYARLVRDALCRRPRARVHLRRPSANTPAPRPLATIVIGERRRDRKLVIGSSFIFPGWQGHLRAYDVTGRLVRRRHGLGAPDDLQLEPSTTPLGRDAGIARGRDLLGRRPAPHDRDPDDRTIYTAIRAGGTATTTLSRRNFARTNVGERRPPPGAWPGACRTSTATTPAWSTSSAARTATGSSATSTTPRRRSLLPPNDNPVPHGRRLRGLRQRQRRPAQGRPGRRQRRHAPLLRPGHHARSSGASSPTTSCPSSGACASSTPTAANTSTTSSSSTARPPSTTSTTAAPGARSSSAARAPGWGTRQPLLLLLPSTSPIP